MILNAKPRTTLVKLSIIRAKTQANSNDSNQAQIGGSTGENRSAITALSWMISYLRLQIGYKHILLQPHSVSSPSDILPADRRTISTVHSTVSLRRQLGGRGDCFYTVCTSDNLCKERAQTSAAPGSRVRICWASNMNDALLNIEHAHNK